MNKLWYIYTTGYISTVKRNEVLITCMREALYKKAYVVLFHLDGVLEQVKSISGDKSKQCLGVDDRGLTGRGQRGLSEVVEMLHILTGEWFIWLSVLVKTYQTVYLGPVQFAICKLYLNK